MRKHLWFVALLLCACSNNAKVNITVTPSNAAIYVDGREESTFPLIISKDQKYVIKAVPYDKNYKPFQATYLIKEDRNITISLKKKTKAELAAEEKQRKYQAYLEQVAQKKAEREARLAALREQCAQVQFIVDNWSWSTPYETAIKAEGLVTNVSGSALQYVKAEVKGFDASGNFISSNYSYLEYNPVLQNQSSPFTVYLNYNPAIEKASLSILVDDQPVEAVSKKEYAKQCGNLD